MWEPTTHIIKGPFTMPTEKISEPPAKEPSKIDEVIEEHGGWPIQ
jgi:hypothetical protein